MKVISPILPKIGCHGNVPWGIGKKLVRIDNIHTNTFHLVKKNRENRSSRSWDSFAQFKKERNYGKFSERSKNTRGWYFTYMPKFPQWSDHLEFWRAVWYLRRNYPRQILWKSVYGFWRSENPKSVYLHRLGWWHLRQCNYYRATLWYCMRNIKNKDVYIEH